MNTSESNLPDPAIAPEIAILPKPKRCGLLNSLSTAQQEQLLDWLEIYPAKTVLEMVVAAPPEGFGIQTPLISLRRFHMRAQAHLQKDLADSHLEVLAEFGSDPHALNRLTGARAHGLRKKLFPGIQR